MTGFDETHQTVQQFVRQFCEREIEPNVPALERGELSPYDVMRRLSNTFRWRR